MDEDVLARETQALCRPEIARVDGLHPQDGIEDRREKRRDEGHENDRRLGARQHEDRERHPGKRRDGPQGLRQRESELTERAVPTYEDAERHPEEHGERESRVSPIHAVRDVRVVKRREYRYAKERLRVEPFLQHHRRRRDLPEHRNVQDRRHQMPGGEDDREAEQQQVRARAPNPAKECPERRRHAASYFAVPFSPPVLLMTPTGSFIPSSAAASSRSFE